MRILFWIAVALTLIGASAAPQSYIEIRLDLTTHSVEIQSPTGEWIAAESLILDDDRLENAIEATDLQTSIRSGNLVYRPAGGLNSCAASYPYDPCVPCSTCPTVLPVYRVPTRPYVYTAPQLLKASSGAILKRVQPVIVRPIDSHKKYPYIYFVFPRQWW